MRTVTVDAPAKVNLFLRVLHRRPDGFHELETLFQAVSLADEVVVSVVEESTPGVELQVDGPDLGPVESNLAYRAAEAFLRRSDDCLHARIRLTKRVPAGAGLGGGSSDAAAVLKCLAALTDFDDDAALRAMGAGLGSDVPFFLSSSATAWARGRGEELTEVDPVAEGALVLALPPVHVDTGDAYARLAEHRAGSRRSPRNREARGGVVGPLGPTGTFDWDRVVAGAGNDFEPIVAGAHPKIAASLSGLRERGARLAMLSGSGAASFGLFADVAEARAAAAWLEGHYGWPFVPVTTLKSMPTPRTLEG